MPKNVIFEELDKDKKILLLRAFDYDVDSNGYVLTVSGSKIQSNENPSTFLHIDNVALTPGSLDVIDGTPTSISRFIREKLESDKNER